MGDDGNPDHAVKGLSAGQMVLLFLAGAAVCAIFFSAGFVVGYNEKSSKAAPVTEQVSETPEIPPVITPEKPRTTVQSGNVAPKVETPAIEPDQPEPLRPTPLAEPVKEAQRSHLNTEAELRRSPVVGPARPSAVSASSANSASGSYMIQVAATGTKPEGEKLVKALQSMSYPAVLLSPQQTHASDNLFRIQVGPFANKESAEKTKAKLMHDGFKQPFIKH